MRDNCFDKKQKKLKSPHLLVLKTHDFGSGSPLDKKYQTQTKVVGHKKILNFLVLQKNS